MPHSLSEYEIGPGRIVAERYEVVRPNRQGGLSVAFEAKDLAAGGEACEVQVFPSSLFDGEKQLGEFAEGWQAWKRVHSPRVLAVREIERVGTTGLVLVTDLPQGEPLRARLQRTGPMASREVVRLGLGILDGLMAIHGTGLVHGDVKPSTVWVALDGGSEQDSSDFASGPVLVDGGTTPGLWSAKGWGDRTALIGTPYYAPVELFGGERPDVQSDVYSAATLLFELATGVQPWAGRTFLEVFQSKLAKKPPTMVERAPDVAVPEDLERVLRGGLHGSRELRYSSATDFRAALQQLADGWGMASGASV